MKVDLSAQTRQAGTRERWRCSEEVTAENFTQKECLQTVHDSEMENHPANVSDFGSDVIIFQNTEKI